MWLKQKKKTKPTEYCPKKVTIAAAIIKSWAPRRVCWLASKTSKLLRVNSSLIRRPIHSVLCHSEAKSFLNFYKNKELVVETLYGQDKRWMIMLTCQDI